MKSANERYTYSSDNKVIFVIYKGQFDLSAIKKEYNLFVCTCILSWNDCFEHFRRLESALLSRTS